MMTGILSAALGSRIVDLNPSHGVQEKIKNNYVRRLSKVALNHPPATAVKSGVNKGMLESIRLFKSVLNEINGNSISESESDLCMYQVLGRLYGGLPNSLREDLNLKFDVQDALAGVSQAHFIAYESAFFAAASKRLPVPTPMNELGTSDYYAAMATQFSQAGEVAHVLKNALSLGAI